LLESEVEEKEVEEKEEEVRTDFVPSCRPVINCQRIVRAR
jgi:hypothetical protein